MPLPESFHFTASNLQDYLSCERRFELKSIDQQLWPALPSQPVQEHETHMRNGALFHQYVQQYLLGVPADQITPLINDAQVLRWWQNFYQYFPIQVLPNFIRSELTLTDRLHEFSLLAKLDAVFTQADQWTIYDWKTGFFRGKSIDLETKVQTRLYLYLLAERGAFLNQGKDIPTHQISMVYWYPEFPQEEIRIAYDQKKHEANKTWLISILREVSAKPQGTFVLTANEKQCQFCIYRSLCDRGTVAGNALTAGEEVQSIDDLDNFLHTLDLEQIAEIAFE